jgi:hypothetical protein
MCSFHVGIYIFPDGDHGRPGKSQREQGQRIKIGGLPSGKKKPGLLSGLLAGDCLF